MDARLAGPQDTLEMPERKGAAGAFFLPTGWGGLQPSVPASKGGAPSALRKTLGAGRHQILLGPPILHRLRSLFANRVVPAARSLVNHSLVASQRALLHVKHPYVLNDRYFFVFCCYTKVGIDERFFMS